MDNDTIFLTTSEAVEAICIDFQQYAPQLMLFSEVLRLISDGRLHLKREPNKEGAWVNCIGGTKMKWLTGEALVEFMCQAIRQNKWQPELLATVCGCVFQTNAMPARSAKSVAPGVSIKTNMAGYVCRQCGRCCRRLDYHNEVTVDDVARWRALQRTDILKWVQSSQASGNIESYRVWVDPASGRVAAPCPFLKEDHNHHRWSCRIHDLKPGICRQYPISRKHAVMTGCRGFEGREKNKVSPGRSSRPAN